MSCCEAFDSRLLDLPITGSSTLCVRCRKSDSKLEWYTYKMNRVFKTFLLWLLLAALPLQGFAAAVQTSCGPMAHHGLSEMAMEPLHHHASDNAANSLTVKSAKPSGDSADAKQKSSFCSACATCCVGAVAPPSVFPLTPVYSSSLAAISTLSPLVTGFIPTGLERPPKRITA